MNKFSNPPISIFTPSFADADNTNAQNLTVKEIVSRLPEDRFRIVMLNSGEPDRRIKDRKNTRLLRYRKHGNTLRLLAQGLLSPAQIYFFPRCGPLDRIFLDIKKRLPLRTALVSYIVYVMNRSTATELVGRSIIEADCVLANSRYVSHTVQQHFGRSAITVHDGVDTRCFFPVKRGENKKLVVLYAGSFQARKRVELVIAQAARFPGIEFRLAGQGETEVSCRNVVEKFGCSNVRFLGHLSQEMLGREMRNADLFLFPSLEEGHPQVLIQAMASGLPCIAMNTYQPDAVINGKTGFLVDSDSELRERFNLLTSNPGVRHCMSVASAEHSKHFQWNQIVKQWIEIFERVAADKRAFGKSQVA